jgi:hypothetical protein
VVNALVEATPISGPGVGVERAGADPRRLRAGDVRQRDEARAALLRRLHRPDRVDRLAGLRDAGDQHRGVGDRIAVAVLRGVVDLDRNPRQLLDQELADERRVPRGAAGEELDAGERAHVVGRELERVEADLAGLEVDPAAEGVAGGLGLLEDLLQHEVLVAALLDLLRIPVEARHRALTAAPARSQISIRERVRRAMSPLSRKITSRVWAMSAAGSEAR